MRKRTQQNSQNEQHDHESQITVEKAELIPDMPTQELSNQPTPTDAVRTVQQPRLKRKKETVGKNEIVRKKQILNLSPRVS